ncbi:uncharacterized protein LOC132204848 [Neocloeon triangulifer]|uniref:uncharacterized protein LOC132204848 n=1 Tax=Neocloeon triangulifer TaxID=2078957 RepID=UPI00286F4C47|nr:uncharacterized protein LOC132204848 [Neocloeon triangulifer]
MHTVPHLIAVVAAGLLLAVRAQQDPPRLSCQPGDPQPPSRVNTTERVNALRGLMQSLNIAAYIVLTNDDHQSEYVADYDERRRFISGFSGSSGWAVVTKNESALWTDSRYFLQADQQLDCDWKLMRDRNAGVPMMEQWLIDNLKAGDVVSADQKTVPESQWQTWLKAFEPQGIALQVRTNSNLVDQVWGLDRPPYPSTPAQVLDETLYAGETWRQKVARVAAQVGASGGQATVVAALDEVAWLLNLRGADVPFTPVIRAYLTLELRPAAQVTLYVANSKLTPAVRTHLAEGQADGVVIKDYEQIWDDLTALGIRVTNVTLPSRFSYSLGVSHAVYERFPSEKVIEIPAPVSVMKDIKNAVEAAGMRNANLRDSAALVKFLAKLEAGVLAGESWDEMRAVAEVAAIRAAMPLSQGPCFESISASGVNSALPHYEPTATTNSPVNASAVYTLDSGGHYFDGSTDVTRTVYFGTPLPIHVEVYTRLLSGCITLASAVFPLGTTLSGLDILARGDLYKGGFDFGHGITHGIGHFLAVHEAFNTTFNENFFGSQEPGFYVDDQWGMRLENIVTVERKNFTGPYAVNKTFLQFDMVTLVPYEVKLIDPGLLTAKQIDWLNSYHARVASELSPLIQDDPVALLWMQERTRPLNSI